MERRFGSRLHNKISMNFHFRLLILLLCVYFFFILYLFHLDFHSWCSSIRTNHNLHLGHWYRSWYFAVGIAIGVAVSVVCYSIVMCILALD